MSGLTSPSALFKRRCLSQVQQASHRSTVAVTGGSSRNAHKHLGMCRKWIFFVFCTFSLICNFTTEGSICAVSVQRNQGWCGCKLIKLLIFQNCLDCDLPALLYYSRENNLLCVHSQAHFIRGKATSGRIKYVSRVLLINYLFIVRILLLCLQISITKLI